MYVAMNVLYHCQVLFYMFYFCARIPAIMSSVAGILRAARGTVAPNLPELAADFLRTPDDPGAMTAVKDALVDAIAEQGGNPAAIEPHDLNKTERSTIVAFLLDKQADSMVQGTGPASTFRLRNQQLIKHPPPHPGYWRDEYGYSNALAAILEKGAMEVETAFTHGSDATSRWLPVAAERYAYLGLEMDSLAGPSSLTQEGGHLDRALRSQGLHIGTVALGQLVYSDMRGASQHERVRAAHDLSHLCTSLASIGVEALIDANNFRGITLANLHGHIVRNPRTGIYQLKPRYNRYGEREDDRRAEVFSRNVPLHAMTIKCPAHAQINNEKEATSLQRILPAAINLMADYNLV